MVPRFSCTWRRRQLAMTFAALLAVALPAHAQVVGQIQGTVTDAQGGYRFADVDAPQAYVVEVRSPTTGALGSATLVLAASEAAVLDITVGPPVQTSTANPAPSSPAPPSPSPSPSPTPPEGPITGGGP